MFDRVLRLAGRPGVMDLICVGLLIAGGLVGAELEPSHAEFWINTSLMVAVPLLGTALLLLSGSKLATFTACAIHALVFVGACGGFLLALLLVVTILMAGFGIVLGPVCALLAWNSAFTVGRALHREWLHDRPEAGKVS